MELYHKVVEVTAPNGKVLQVTRAGEVVAGLLWDGSGLLMVRQWRAGSRSHMIEAVAGVIDGNERPDQAFVRESREEAGVRPRQVVHMGTFLTSPGWTDEKGHLFFGSDLIEDPLEQDEGEDVKTVWYYNCKVDDVKTQLMILLAKDKGLLPASFGLTRQTPTRTM